MTAEDLIKGLIALGFDGDYKDDDIYTLEEKNHKERKRVVLENKKYKCCHIRVDIDWLNVKMTLLRTRKNGGTDMFGNVSYVEGPLLECGSAERFLDDFIVKILKQYSL